MGLTEQLRIVFDEESPDCVKATMPVDEKVLQPFGYLHGGATIALLETVASKGAEIGCAADEIPFGIDVHVAHRSSVRGGIVLGEAHLSREDTTSKGHRRQYWDVVARKEDGSIVSDGEIVCLIVKG